MTAFLGIDLGTSSVKALTMAADSGEVLATASTEYAIQQPQPDRAEQQPSDWWQATIATVRQVVADTPDEIAAIGFSGQMHGTVLLDDAGEVLHPAIIWADQRTGETVQQMQDQHPDAIHTTGTVPAAGFLGATLVWLRDHQPDLLDAAATVILPKDYIRWRMTGDLATDISDAAGTALFDVQAQTWADDLIAAYELPRAIFPRVIQAYDVAGTLQATAADAMNLPAEIPVVAGCADQPAQALGNGITRPGIASVTVGSGGQVFMPLSQVNTDERLHVFCHATGGVYALGATLAAGLSLRWLRNTLDLADDDDAFAALSESAGSVAAGADGLLFLPYLNGERTPHMDAQARGGFIGLSMAHTRGHLARAIMEGVAFSVKQAYEACLSVSESAPEMLVLSGGGAESSVWRQILTDVLGQPCVKSLRHEQAALGAAMLGGIGTRYYADSIADNIEAVRDIVAEYDAPTQPDAATSEFYAARYAQFTQAYPLLKPLLHALAQSSDEQSST